MKPVKADRAQILRLAGPIGDSKIAAILATSATAEEVEEAAAWAAGESDLMGRERRRLTGAAAAVYEILTADRQLNEEEPG
jgi:hypothetical protein